MSFNSPLTTWTLVVRSLSYFARNHLTLAVGIAAATAVIVGALVVGDSVRGSLQGLVVDRLSSIECLLHARTFFDPAILDELDSSSTETSANLIPAIISESSTVENRDSETFFRASQVQVLGVDDRFFDDLLQRDAALFAHRGHSDDGPNDDPRSQDASAGPKRLGADEIALNASLARELSAEVGDELAIRLANPTGVPADNPLGRRDEAYISLPRQRVVAIIPDKSIGGFSLQVGQGVPRNVFASLATLQDILEQTDRVNAALVMVDTPSNTQTSNISASRGQQLCDALNLQLHPRVEDYGLQLNRHQLAFSPPDGPDSGDSETGDSEGDNASAVNGQADVENSTDDPASVEPVYDYWQLTSNELILEKPTSDAVIERMEEGSATRLLTYLANSMTRVEPTRQDMAASRRADYLEAHRDSDRPRFPMETHMLSVSSLEPSGNQGFAPDQEPQPALSREVPYSIVVGVEPPSELELSRFTENRSRLQVPHCWINSWTAEQLEAEAGDWVQITFFEPETVDGRRVERAERLMIAGIVPLTKPADPYRRRQPAKFTEPPTIFNDPNLTPKVPGVTDQASISNWDLPFPLDLEDQILPVDDEYWNNHRLTPKLFLPYEYAASSGLFGSRFGDTTAIRFPAERVSSEDELRTRLREALLTTRRAKGLMFLPIRATQLQAASGTTPFDMLFLSLSLFVIIAALLLVSLLFKLGIHKRITQLGLLSAQGFPAPRIRNLMLRELTIVAAVGAVGGILLGLGYARLMIAGLESWWIEAISAPFLEFSFRWQSLLIGAAAGMLTSLATIYVTLRKFSRVEPLSMLRGQDPESIRVRGSSSKVMLALAILLSMTTVVLLFSGLGQTGMARAGIFFGSGMLLLLAALIGIRQWIEAGMLSHAVLGRSSLFQLAMRAIGRNPVRSTLSLGLLAVASFLITSMGVFQVSPDERGYGGFDLIGQTSQPIYENIASSSVRQEVLGNKAEVLAGTTVVPLRARPGEDASCTNLFQVSQPTVLGVPQFLASFYEYAPSTPQFAWGATIEPDDPWSALDASASGRADDPIPVVIDQNTAAWSLKQGASLGAITELEYDKQKLHFETVGLLSNSVLQGKLMISEKNFQQVFPELSGYRYFLIRSGERNDQQDVASGFEEGWSDVGFDTTPSRDILQELLGVQNTYISAFQSLGALGLLLGTFGLVAVQIRSVIERRRELALMQAIGFSQSRIAGMLTLETAILLLGGLLIGSLAAGLALVSYILEVGPELSLLSPLAMLSLVLLAGFIAATLAVRTATRQSLLANLRNE